MQPTPAAARMLSPHVPVPQHHPDGQPRPLTTAEEARITRALRNDPPIYWRPTKLAAQERRPTPRQPWQAA
jgi:hypothetical protein